MSGGAINKMGKSIYDRISEDNIRKYGTEYEKVLRIIINQYSDRTHFIYEILQNAEDAGATGIRFVQYSDRLEVMHDGKSFTTENLQGLSDLEIPVDSLLDAVEEALALFRTPFSSVQTSLVSSTWATPYVFVRSGLP